MNRQFASTPLLGSGSLKLLHGNDSRRGHGQRHGSVHAAATGQAFRRRFPGQAAVEFSRLPARAGGLWSRIDRLAHKLASRACGWSPSGHIGLGSTR
ncbi:hypothetical protein [Amycolatopsis sp. NPDC054798]